jgi:hypothetical protein
MHSTGLNAGGVAYMLWYVGQRIPHMQAALGIRIRMFLGFPDPDPLVRDTDPAPFSHKCVERTEIMLATNLLIQNFGKKLNFHD